MPKPGAETRAAFQQLIVDGPDVAIRPMFGNLAAFVNGNMFAGLFGEALFVRLGEDEQAEAAAQGAVPFAPMAGRPMKGYLTLPPGWREDAATARAWVERALAFTRALPPKEKKQPRRRA